MQINRLRLLGFKSFVDPTELIVERGLTGVVGPNGCGKSNLLEALRWVMGETSHKSMRAAAMDDVIFAGTNHRPPRNAAEVTIFLDNSGRKAPAEFNDHDTIEITRRIEREAGSAYRVNGRDVRARDVKILFEDAATGARSPALVRQGQISEIVNAKPEQRRRILEDAAGIAGLHSRRHEAELRLKAAEGNLARLGDVLGGLNSQMEGLKRQARAARRYKDISAEIRKAEALLLHLTWSEAQTQVDAEEKSLLTALETVGQAIKAEADAIVAEAELAASLQPMREEETRRAAALARLKAEEESYKREAMRAAERETELKARLAQIGRDTAREQELIAEAQLALERLTTEIEELAAADAGADDTAMEAEERLAAAGTALAAAEKALSELTHRAAEIRARRRSLEQGLAERRATVDKLKRQQTALETQRREIAARAPDAVKLAETTETSHRLAAEIGDLQTRTIAAEVAARDAGLAAASAREANAKARLAAGQLKTEMDTLAKLLLPARDAAHPPVADALTVAPGYETALGAALGDDLEAPIDGESPVHWGLIAPEKNDPKLPAGVQPLGDHVEAPPELARTLAQIGVVEPAAAERLQRLLKPGQRLVSKAGGLWRWDGYVAAADGATPAAQRLAERNRLKQIAREEASARAAAEAAAAAEHAAAAAFTEAQALERELRQLWRETQTRLDRTREALIVIERAARETETKLAAVDESRQRAEEDLLDAHERLDEIELALDGLTADEDLGPALDAAQAATATRRAALAQIQAELAALERERRHRTERLAAACGELARYAQRNESGARQVASLDERRAEAERELADVAEMPALIEEKRLTLLDAMADAERARQAAADQLATADTSLRRAKDTLRSAQATAATERETKARVEARLEAARARRAEEARRIRETLGVTPEGCLALAELTDGQSPPDLGEADRQLTRLKADRERLGGVNLQAEEELTRITEQFTAMDTEKNDIEQAIAKLRGAIGSLNREGKKRLQEAFDTVNGHFQRLFTTLFGGGEARLDMIDADDGDPLAGGLEIVAKPPGKKPATLSLLSGGEQTLTALSLIFAVFLTNPSPICVLDEVDAPLDDANVDRFCTLMEKMAEETATRFLVITHHPMTMSRMNRLFGVTMGEKGVSQLVSVNLEIAQQFLEAV